MVSFVCDVCQETIKKPKLDNHKSRCPHAVFSCIDCSKTFSGTDYRNHTSCITEVEKYQKGKNSKLNNFLNPKGESFSIAITHAKNAQSASSKEESVKVESSDKTEEVKKEKGPLEKEKQLFLKAIKKNPLSYHKICKKFSKKGKDFGNLLSNATFILQNDKVIVQL